MAQVGLATVAVDLGSLHTVAVVLNGADVFLDLTNLTNRNNVVAYDQSIGADVVFQQTGVPGNRLILTDGSPLYGASRTVYFGSRFRF